MSRIVIIEDDVLMRSLMAEWLTAEGYGVNTGANQTEARTPADLVIVDVYMPRHLGVERLRKARSTYPGAPMIAISGQFRPGCSLRRSRRAGARRGARDRKALRPRSAARGSPIGYRAAD
jgi:CheY-like chemotaxis protein